MTAWQQCQAVVPFCIATRGHLVERCNGRGCPVTLISQFSIHNFQFSIKSTTFVVS